MTDDEAREWAQVAERVTAKAWADDEAVSDNPAVSAATEALHTLAPEFYPRAFSDVAERHVRTVLGAVANNPDVREAVAKAITSDAVTSGLVEHDGFNRWRIADAVLRVLGGDRE